MKAYYLTWLLILLLNCEVLSQTIPAPTTVNAGVTGSSATSVGINWSYVSPYSTYEIWRADGLGNTFIHVFTKTFVGDQNSAYFIDSDNIQAVLEYCYKVRIKEETDYSDFSPTDCYTTPNIDPPEKFSISGQVTLNNIGLSEATLTFGGFQTTTDNNGDYTILNVNKGLSGYLITSKENYTFVPDSYYIIDISSNMIDKNFVSQEDPGTDVDDESSMEYIPADYELFQNYPNPFNPSTKIRFAIPQSENVSLEVYNMMGQRIAVLVDGFLNAGYHAVEFHSSHLSSGIYFYKIQTSDYKQIRKMVFMK